MTRLKDMLERLDLSQYLDAFVNEGFDSWETLMDITESDLEALGVKLGHRRKLQRAILNSNRDVVPLGLLSQAGSVADDGRRSEDTKAKGQQELSSNQQPRGKRKYRRHPKPDEYAPERPPSAYVIFSNQMRDKLKGQELSFAEIAKLVGERWQELSAQEKEPCEKEAQALKDKYYSELGEYKKTSQYAQYQGYLADFKAKHGDQNSAQDTKKPKLPTNNSTTQSPHVSVQDAPSRPRAPSVDSTVSSNEPSVAATSPNYPSRPPDSPTGSDRSPNVGNFRRFPPPRPPSDDGPPQHQHPRRFPMTFYQSYTCRSAPDPNSSIPSLGARGAPSFSATLPSLARMESTGSTIPSEYSRSQFTLPSLDSALTAGRTMPIQTPSPAKHGPPASLKSEDSQASDIKAKTSLATLLRATEQVDREAERSNTSSGSRSASMSQNRDRDRPS